MTDPSRPEEPERAAGGVVLPTLLRYELLQLVRDRRTVLIAVVAPLVLFPLLIFLMRWSEERREEALEETLYEYAVTGPAADTGRVLVREALALPEESPAPEGGEGGVGPGADERGPVIVGPDDPGPDPGPVRFAERLHPDPDSLLRAGDLHVVVRALGPEASDSLAPVPALVLSYRASSDLSRAAAERLSERLQRLRNRRRQERFRERGFPVDLDRVAPVESVSLATAREEAGSDLALFLTPLVVMLMLGGGTVVAADAISGEKERGTLETLLTSAVRRSEIVGAKLLSIVAVGVVVTVVNLANLLLYVVVGVLELPEGFAASLPPETLLLLLVLYAPIALLVASVLLLLSGFSGSYKEYQIYALPVTVLFLVPAAAAALPGIDLRSFVSVVPLAGVSVGVKEVLTGEYDWALLAVAFVSTTGAAAWGARLTGRFLSTERLVTSAEIDAAELWGGSALFPRHVLRWFGLLWVALVLLSLWWGGALGVRGQVLLNVVGLFLGGSILMIRRYRLDVRRALALRGPHPAVWIAVLVGAPSALLSGSAIFRLAELVFPVPQRVIEAFSQYLLPGDLPLWQVLFFLAFLPAICEEIAFRGVLLYGLRRKLGYVGLALTVGAIFGLFHVQLFRLIPTAYLGVILTAVVLLSGSIYPAMLWHALNNAAGLLAAEQGVRLTDATPELIVVGFAGLALALWVLWRTRRPYPEVGEERGFRPWGG